MEVVQTTTLVIQIIGGILTLLTAVAVMTGKLFSIKTHTRVMLDKQAERISHLENENSENKRTHALLLKCNMAIIDGLKRGKINGELKDVEDEINKKIFEHIGGNTKQ